MIPAPFDYLKAGSVAEAVAALAEHEDEAKLVAGGHSLLPMMKMRLAAPSILVDIRGLTDLSYIRLEGDEVAIGGLTRHRDLVESPVLRDHAPLLASAASYVGDPQIRNRGTIGGSIAHADPAADLPCGVLASEATLVAQGTEGRRTIPAADFFTGFFETALRPDELLVEIRVPAGTANACHYEKFTRRANDWAIVAVAVVDGKVALANMGSKPVRAHATERALAEGASVADAAALAAEDTTPLTDMHGNAEYRKHLARVLTRRVLVASGR